MPATTSRGQVRQIERDPAQWIREFTDPEVLKFEREKLSTRAWTLLGLTRDLTKDGDWIRADLWGHSVFVQNFRGKLAAFENVCAHRFFPLRTEDKGNGQLRCGLHGWVYNGEGNAIGIPLCEELFGKKPGEIERHLRPVEFDTCGGLVFGRLPAEPGDNFFRQTLAEYLGPFRTPIKRMTENTEPIGTIDNMNIAANWKICYHLTLEDYHIGTAHPKTFSAKGYLKPEMFRYFFSGPHSAMFSGEQFNESSLVYLQAECAQGRLPRHGYIIFQIFPNMLISMHWAGTIYIGLYSGATSVETMHRAWAIQAREPNEPPFDEEKKRGIMDFSNLTAEEDGLSTERLQQVISQAGIPSLGGQEERIAYFDKAYTKFMAS